MKEKIVEISKKPAFKLLLLSICWIMIIIPLLSTFHLLNKTFRVSLVFLVINNLLAVYIGRYIKLHKLNSYLMFIFPAVFMIQVIARYGRYGYLYGIIYLLVSFLAYIMTKK